MRLARLDLVRYGKFTGRTLDFGPARGDRPDLHIVYGPNEAGKSTAFAAFLDFLFGIRATKEPNYAFLHPYPTMRVGARLELSGGARDLVRIRRAQATLLDGEDRPVDEGLIAAELGGIGRDAYRSMFSLDDESLEQGGDEILASRGDLGRLLFSGSAGAAGLSQALDAMREEADLFFRPGAQKTRLNELKAELDALKAERDAIDTQAAVYRRHIDERDRAASAYEAALAARGAAGARRDEIGRLLAALPQRSRLGVLRDRLAPLLTLPEPPAGWAAERSVLDKEEVRLDEEARGIAREAQALAEEFDRLAVDEAALDLGPAHDGLAALRAAAVTAGKDLPRRRPNLAAVDGAVSATLIRLGRPADADAEAVMLPAALVGILRALIAERSGVVARRDDALHEAEAAARDLAAARDALGDDGGDGGPAGSGPALARLAGTVEALSQADAARHRRMAERACGAAEDRLAEALRSLAPWPGTGDQLATLALPALRDVEAWASDIAGAEAETLRRDGEVGDLATERRALQAEVDALGRVAGPIGDAEAMALRAARERAWATHRAKLDAATAEDFEDALRRDDATTAARFGQVADVARLRQSSLTLAGLETRLAAASDRAEAGRGRGAALRARVAGALAAIDPPFPTPPTPASFAAWLARTGPALRARGEARAAIEALGRADADLAAWHGRLAAALVEAGVTHDGTAGLDGLAAVARTAIDRAASRDARVKAFGEARLRGRERDAALLRAENADARWRARWDDACRSCWLGDSGETPSPAAVAEILEILGTLAPDLRTRDDLRHRIVAMEGDQARFATLLAPLAVPLGLGATADPDRALDIDGMLDRRIRDARTAHAAREACRARRVEVEARRRQAATAAAENRARGDVMRSFFGVDTLAAVGATLERCEARDGLRRAIDELERDLRTGLRVSDIASVDALLDGQDAAVLEAERDAAEGRYEAADLDLRTHHAARSASEAALDAVGGDDRVARIDGRRRVVLLDIEEQARRFIRLKGGIAAAEQALAAYRDRHRSAMLDEASKAFAAISRGHYAGLAAQPSDKGEILIARSAEGPTKQAADLSKGTRFQLYLALRAAGYREFAATRRTTVPFVADDIMETFDDFRAEEAFRLFADMATVGQVIYLTHHLHLIDIAKGACPGVTVHDLSLAS